MSNVHPTVAIVNTGGANINSIQQALMRLGAESIYTSDLAIIQTATHVILPGVGAAGDAMKRLQENQLVEHIRELKQPVLGICLGMQLYYETSDENDATCLGILSGRVKLFEQRENRTVPHMGWNRVRANKDSALFAGIPDDSYFYYVHSYFCPNTEWNDAESDYDEKFPAAVAKNNFYGVQFHPEKSSDVGAQLLRNFLKL